MTRWQIRLLGFAFGNPLTRAVVGLALDLAFGPVE